MDSVNVEWEQTTEREQPAERERAQRAVERTFDQPNPYDVMVLQFGANDGQNIQLDDGTVLQRFSPEWYAEYQTRTERRIPVFVASRRG